MSVDEILLTKKDQLDLKQTQQYPLIQFNKFPSGISKVTELN